MKKKILFFDIDGTLLTEDTHTVPKSTVKALRKAREKGHLLYINTGRAYSIIDTFLQDIGFDGYVCGCGTYIKSGNNILLSRTIDVTECRRIIELLRTCNIDAILEGFEDVYFDDRFDMNPRMKKTKEYFTKKGFGLTKDWNSNDITFDKFFCVANENSNLKLFRKQMEDNYDIIDRENNCYEVIPKGFSKATGIEFLLNHYQLSIEDAFAFGDSSNDLPMLEYVPNSVAMGQSTPSVLDIASFVTKSIHEDGIEYALKHYGII